MSSPDVNYLQYIYDISADAHNYSFLLKVQDKVFVQLTFSARLLTQILNKTKILKAVFSKF